MTSFFRLVDLMSLNRLITTGINLKVTVRKLGNVNFVQEMEADSSLKRYRLMIRL